MDTYELVTLLGITADMTKEYIQQKLFDYFREIYDGQVSDIEVEDIADSCLDSVLDYVKENLQ